MQLDDLRAARGRPAYASDGAMIGDVDAIYYDNETRQPEWLGIVTGFVATRRVLAPVQGVELDERGVRLAQTRERVLESPPVDGDEIDEATVQELYTHYGVSPAPPADPEPDLAPERAFVDEPEPALEEAAYDEADTTADVPPEVTEIRPPGVAESVTRSEEELVVGKSRVEAGRVRLRKWVETEPVAVDVELQRETVRVVREPLDQPVEGAEIGEAEIEVRLKAEQPVVQKQTVAKERILLEKDVELGVETVRDEVRKERVEIEGPNIDAPDFDEERG